MDAKSVDWSAFIHTSSTEKNKLIHSLSTFMCIKQRNTQELNSAFHKSKSIDNKGFKAIINKLLRAFSTVYPQHIKSYPQFIHK